MKKTIVVYYSRSGNNKFIAEKMAQQLDCELVAIRSKMNFFPLLMLFKNGFGIKPIEVDFKQYEQIVLVGPVWMGKLVSPLRGFIQQYGNDISRYYFATCCASIEAEKNKKFGYTLVFNALQELIGEKCIHCEPFSVELIAADDMPKTNEHLMKIRLSNDNFKGEIQKRMDAFVLKVNN